MAEVNLASVINSNVATFPVTSSGLLWQAVLKGSGDQRVTLNSVTVTATSDTSPPNNPSTASGKDSVSGSVTLTSGNWYNYTAPYFSWTPPSDPPSGSGGVSGVAGYYVYYGTDSSADPLTAGSFQTAANYTAGSMTTGQTYYLRIKAKDIAGNTNASASALFTYKFDSVAPAEVDYVNVSPVGCSTGSLFNFEWPASSDASSGIAGYEYRLGSTGTIQDTTAETASAPAYQVGDNVFYVRAKDNAGNVSAFQTGIYCSTEVATIVDGPTVVAGPSSLTVSWTSSKATTSFVRVQDGDTYVSEQGMSSLSISHSVKVVGLEPEKTYRYKLVWTDSGGNLGETTFFETTTTTAPTVRNFSAEVLSPSSVLLSWQTTEQSSATVEYGIGSYSSKKVIGGEATSFTSRLTGLAAGSNYQIRVAARTADGYRYFYSVNVQTPPLPIISNLRFDYLPEAQ
ncbi:MAG: fibronectin type III domain-containing protein, partial [Candidatus Andersenbacteria bacterium]